MVNNPFPESLKRDVEKSARIIRKYCNLGPTSNLVDKMLIPKSVFQNAKGLIIMTIVKAGFAITFRTGSGILVTKLEDGTWSAPLAIVATGFGAGFHVGMENSDLIIVLNSDEAVDKFLKTGSISVGGSFSAAVASYGRNAGIDLVNFSSAPVFVYGKAKGLFLGVGLEFSGFIQRKKANSRIYGANYKVEDIRYGRVEKPSFADELYDLLDARIPKATAAPSNLKLIGSSPIQYARVLFDYEPVRATDLRLVRGREITVLEKGEGGWWKGRCENEEGDFPSNYVELV